MLYVAKLLSLYTYYHETSYILQRLPMSRGCTALLILGSKGQGHSILITENSLCHIIAFPLPVRGITHFSYKFSIT